MLICLGEYLPSYNTTANVCFGINWYRGNILLQKATDKSDNFPASIPERSEGWCMKNVASVVIFCYPTMPIYCFSLCTWHNIRSVLLVYSWAVCFLREVCVFHSDLSECRLSETYLSGKNTPWRSRGHLIKESIRKHWPKVDVHIIITIAWKTLKQCFQKNFCKVLAQNAISKIEYPAHRCYHPNRVP